MPFLCGSEEAPTQRVPCSPLVAQANLLSYQRPETRPVPVPSRSREEVMQRGGYVLFQTKNTTFLPLQKQRKKPKQGTDLWTINSVTLLTLNQCYIAQELKQAQRKGWCPSQPTEDKHSNTILSHQKRIRWWNIQTCTFISCAKFDWAHLTTQRIWKAQCKLNRFHGI